jgi:hypothetical protein
VEDAESDETPDGIHEPFSAPGPSSSDGDQSGSSLENAVAEKHDFEGWFSTEVETADELSERIEQAVLYKRTFLAPAPERKLTTQRWRETTTLYPGYNVTPPLPESPSLPTSAVDSHWNPISRTPITQLKPRMFPRGSESGPRLLPNWHANVTERDPQNQEEQISSIKPVRPTRDSVPDIPLNQPSPIIQSNMSSLPNNGLRLHDDSITITRDNNSTTNAKDKLLAFSQRLRPRNASSGPYFDRLQFPREISQPLSSRSRNLSTVSEEVEEALSVRLSDISLISASTVSRQSMSQSHSLWQPSRKRDSAATQSSRSSFGSLGSWLSRLSTRTSLRESIAR